MGNAAQCSVVAAEGALFTNSQPVVSNLGTGNTIASGATCIIGSYTVTAGTLVVVAVWESNTTGGVGTLSDGTNTYTMIASQTANATNADGVLSLWYVANAAAVSAGTLTYTKSVTGTSSCMSAIAATNIATVSPLDVSTTAFGSGTAVSCSPTNPGFTGELFVSVAGTGISGSGTFTQTGNYLGFPAAIRSGNLIADLAGGHMVNFTKVHCNATMTCSISSPWAMIVASFKHA